MSMLEYKGYHAKIDYSVEDKVLFGEVIGINDLIVFESENANEIEQNFHDAIDDYLSMCARHNKEPEKEYSGSFNVRISKELHKQLVLRATKEEVSLNKLVQDLLQEGMKKEKEELPVILINEGIERDTSNMIYSFDGKKALVNMGRYEGAAQWHS